MQEQLRFMQVISRVVTRVVCEYRDREGVEYRKGFESNSGEPEVPEYGTHEELNAVKAQGFTRCKRAGGVSIRAGR